MNKFFCTSCGSKNLYEIEKPKFCGDCGYEINESITQKASEKDQGAGENEGGEPHFVINAEKLEVEIEEDKRVSLVDVIYQKRKSYPKNTNETKR